MMTRAPLTLLAFIGLSSSAFAAPKTVDWTGYPSLADKDNDGFPGLYAGATAAPTGYTGKIDCRDDIATINPGAKEVVADGIDQDCTGRDLIFPVSDPTVARYRANYGGSWDPIIFVADYKACSAAAECDVDDVAGKFAITAAAQETHVFVDVFVNGTKTWRNKGQKADGREVVSMSDWSLWHEKYGGSGSGSGVGKPYIDGSVKVLREERDKLREEMLSGDAVLDAQVTIIEINNIDRDAKLIRLANVDTVLEGRIAANEDAIAAEEKARKAADTRIEGVANGAVATADAAASHGPLIEAGAIGGGISHRPLETSGGDEIRGGVIGGGGFELRAGVDAEGWQTAGFGQFSFGSDGQGTGPDTALLVGADVLFDAGSVEVGPWVGYLRTEDHANLLDVSVIENGGLVGVTLEGDTATDSAARIVPFARAGVGIGYYGARGSDENGPTVVSNYGGLGLFQAGIRFGAGALQD